VIAIVALVLAASALRSRHEVSGDEAVRALEGLGYRLEWRRAPRPPGVERLLAGRATDSHRVAVNFVVAVYDGPAYEEHSTSRPLPVVAHAAHGDSSCANYTLVTDASDPSVTQRTRARRGRMRYRIERALDDFAPGHQCEL
jgi:hypothetical protein